MSEYRVGGRWDVHQSNGFHVIFEIGQHPADGQELVGSASPSRQRPGLPADQKSI